MPAAVDRPLYSTAAMPMSAVDVVVAVIVGLVPVLAVIGAVHTDCSVPSAAAKWLTSVNESPAESVTDFVVAFAALQTPTSTMSRLPVLTPVGGVTASEPTLSRWSLTC
jgi:hypothetical protein